MSTVRTNTLSNAAGSASVPVDTVISGSAKAWVNFNGTGTVAIRAAFNVSSITDNGTGDYTVNFTTAMPDANYAAQLQCMNNAANNFIGSVYQNAALTGSLRVWTGTTSALTDSAAVYVSIFR